MYKETIMNRYFRSKIMNVFRKCLACLILLGMVSIFLAGCNTLEGAGKDIERGGEKIQDAAD